MTIIKFPEPEKLTFEMLMRNPERDRAEGVIQTFIQGMKDEGISRGAIVRTLFHHVIEELKNYDEEVETSALNAEHTNIVHEIDERWGRIRDALENANPGFFRTPV